MCTKLEIYLIPAEIQSEWKAWPCLVGQCYPSVWRGLPGCIDVGLCIAILLKWPKIFIVILTTLTTAGACIQSQVRFQPASVSFWLFGAEIQTAAVETEISVLTGDLWDTHLIVRLGAKWHWVTLGMCELSANRDIGSCSQQPTLLVGVLLICLSVSSVSSSL